MHIIELFNKLTSHLVLLNQKSTIMYKNFKVVFKHSIFTCIRDIGNNIHYFLDFKMSISNLWLCVHNLNFTQVNILFSVIKQQIINDIQQF